MAEKRFTRSAHIARPPEEVWAFLADSANAPRWIEGVVEIKPVSEGPVRAGTVLRETRTVGKRTETYDLEVRAFEPPRRYAAGAKVGKAEFVYTYDLVPAKGGTDVTMTAVGSGAGLMSGLAVGVAMKYMEKADGAQLDRLKAALEGGAKGR